jgi:hypothetical protein
VRAASELIEIFGRRHVDLGTLAAGATESAVVARGVCVAGFSQAIVLLRVHRNDVVSPTTVALRCVSEAPSEEDPEQDFLLGTDAAALQLDASTATGTLLARALEPDFSFALRFILDVTNNDAGTLDCGTAELSADLLVRRGVTRPCTYRETFAYDAADASAYYVPFRNVAEGASIDYRHTLIVPVGGTVERVSLYSASSPGQTTVGFHKNGSTTAAQSVTTNWSGIVTDFWFPPTARFDAGDRLHIRVDPSSTPGEVMGTLGLRLDNEFLGTEPA